MEKTPGYAEGNDSDTPCAFTRQEQLYKAREEFNKEKQV
jgi:hypothetical protein